jgi:hypothetical protein
MLTAGSGSLRSSLSFSNAVMIRNIANKTSAAAVNPLNIFTSKPVEAERLPIASLVNAQSVIVRTKSIGSKVNAIRFRA